MKVKFYISPFLELFQFHVQLVPRCSIFIIRWSDISIINLKALHINYWLVLLTLKSLKFTYPIFLIIIIIIIIIIKVHNKTQRPSSWQQQFPVSPFWLDFHRFEQFINNLPWPIRLIRNKYLTPPYLFSLIIYLSATNYSL